MLIRNKNSLIELLMYVLWHVSNVHNIKKNKNTKHIENYKKKKTTIKTPRARWNYTAPCIPP